MKKILTKVLALTVIASMAFAFAGCSKKKLVEKGKLIMATNAYFPPYEYYDGTTIVGIDAEIAQAIADDLGLELEIVDVEFDSIIAGVQAGKYDIGMAGMTVTDERKQSVNFTASYATGIQSVIVTEDSPITSVEDLIDGDYVVGVQQGTTGDIYMTDEVGDDRIDRYSKGNDAVLALTQGKVDAVVIDNQPAIAYVAANEGLKILDTPYAIEDYAICVRLDNDELLSDIDASLAKLQADGTIDAIISKYIPADS
ncbi:MAG: transporter substrate-binding domain-containing protein [Saccharofermentans sp.]|nr:transporter substrate-binding domain-containing protein [Saccharofermentans sp.]